MDLSELQRHLDLVFDQGLVHHGFTDYMRDYELIVYCTADPRTGVAPTNIRLLFKHCVVAEVETAVPAAIWKRSLDDRLIDYDTGVELDGYVWGVKWQVLYPGATVLTESERAGLWERELGIRFHEARIETNGHNINLVFSDLQVNEVATGYTPIVVGHGGPDFKFPLS
jgi:hypothetical protein